MYLLQSHIGAQIDYLEWLNRGAIENAPLGTNDFHRIGELIAKYTDVPMDFADAALVAIAERVIATFDSDFSIYRTNTKKPLINIFNAMR